MSNLLMNAFYVQHAATISIINQGDGGKLEIREQVGKNPKTAHHSK